MRDKILVVDDTRLNREFLKNILEDEYEIIQAQNGKEALLILKKQYQEIVLVILDLVMSDVDGFAVLEVMRRYKWLEVTPVIVMSGQNSSDAERKSLAMGASDFIRPNLRSIFASIFRSYSICINFYLPPGVCRIVRPRWSRS